MNFPADLKYLPDMILYVSTESKKLGLEKKHLYKLELVCEEALVNIISYAYPFSKDRKNFLQIVCAKRGNSYIEVTIRDQGVAFNPIDSEIHADVEKTLEERNIGGLGIYLIRKIIDEASYQRVGEENILRLALRI